MAMTFQPEHEVVMNAMMQDLPEAIPGKMFGMPCYKVNGKLAVGLSGRGIVLKVGQEKARDLIASGAAETFEPMPGRAWKDWVLLTDNFEAHKALFAEAVEQVRQTT